MKKIYLLLTAFFAVTAMSAQTYKLTDMTETTFASGGDTEWSFEKYNYNTGLYSRFTTYTDSSTCNYVDIYQPERVGGNRITEIDGVSPNGEFTWASNMRYAWCDQKFTAPARTNSHEKFTYVARDSREGYGFEAFGNRDYASVISFTVPADGYYKVDGTVIREDGNNMAAINIIPRYRFASATNINFVNTKVTMGLKFAYGAGGQEITGYDGNCTLANGASQRFTAQAPTDFTLAFQGKKGDVISFEVNVPNFTSDWARDAWSRTFYKALNVTTIDETTALAATNFVNPYATSDANALLDLIDNYQSELNAMSIGEDYGQIPSYAAEAFKKVCQEITTAYDAGALNNMNISVYKDEVEVSWKAVLSAQVANDFTAPGNHRMFYFDTSTNSVKYDTNLMANNTDSPWGFYGYNVSVGTYTKMPNHDTSSKFGTAASAWYNKAGDWFFISDNGNMHPLTTVAPTIMFTAQNDGIFKVNFACYRTSPNVKVENPLYIRCRYMDSNTTTCNKDIFMYSKQYGSVANDGMQGKAPISMNFFVKMKKGDKITFEEDAYTSNKNSSANTLITNLSICSKVEADVAYTVEDAKASGLDYYDPYVIGDATELKAEVTIADSVDKAHVNELGFDGGQYSPDTYNALIALINEANSYIAMEGQEAATQKLFDSEKYNLANMVTAFIASRAPYEIVISGPHSISISASGKFLTQKNYAGDTYGNYYAAYMTMSDVIADTIKNSTSLNDYNWTFNFTQVDTITGTYVTCDKGYMTANGYIVRGVDVDPQANALRFYTFDKNDNVFAIKRNDGKYWTNSFTWASPYDKVNTSTTPQYIFAVDNTTLTKVELAGSGIKTVEATRYFSITGAAVNKPSKGLYIRQILFTDGTRKSDKVIIR